MSIDEDIAWVGQTLIEAERKRCLARVLSVKSEDAVGKGENYASDMRRVKLSFLLHSGELQERSLIFKVIPNSVHHRANIKKNGLFAKEAKVYRDVLAELELILREKYCHSELLWPEFYGVKGSCDGLLFEDLCDKGYKMANRQIGMDFDHATLVIRSLAKFHALGAVLREKGDLNISDFSNPKFLEDAEIIDNWYKNTFEELAVVLEQKWKGEWAQYGDRVRKLAKILGEKLRELFKKGDDKRFCTLNHGDCWLNNIMFRYGKNGKPAGIRFIDFQVSHYNQPVIDIQYFFQTSLNLDARRRKGELVEEYSSSLEENLTTFGYKGKVPTREEILESYRETYYFGAGIGIGTLPVMMIPSEKAPDMEELSEKINNKDDLNLSFYDYEGEAFVNALKFVLKEAEENGVM